MSGSENQEGEQRRSGRALTVVFWFGVGLAPLAALVLILGGSQGSMKIAAVLALLAVVLIGLSITLRKDTDSVRLELEDTILDEVDALREDVRHDIATAARATHRQFSEKLQYLHDSVEALRAQVEAMRLGYDRADARPAGVPGPPPGAPHAGAHHVGPGGVVRQTETVHVTTRHTIVDPHAEGQDGRGTVYGRSAEPPPARRPEPPPARRPEPPVWREPEPVWREPERAGRHDAGPGQVSWTEERLRERFEAARAEEDVAVPSRRGRYDDDPGDDERWAGMRAGDRWASVRTDDRGRELRMGERRAAMHSDETGTEMRFEDRWTSVRRDEPRVRYDEPTSRWDEERWERRGGPAALPAASSAPTWDDQGWHEDEAPRAGRRRYDWDEEPEEATTPRSRPRRPDYEYIEDRWT